MILVNPGSEMDPRHSGAGWTNTVETARKEAARWLREMHDEGLTDVVLLPGEEEHEGRWRFSFQHTVTAAVVVLETHGLDDVNAYERERIFAPRVYWAGSSIGNPKVEDFAAPGFRVHQTFLPDPGDRGPS